MATKKNGRKARMSFKLPPKKADKIRKMASTRKLTLTQMMERLIDIGLGSPQ
jgi:hypothetical protein